MDTTLNKLQGDFQRYLLTLDGPMAKEVVSDALDAQTRLGIYADAYRLRLLEALQTDFVALRAVLGDDEFDAMGRAYIDAYPSQHYSIRHFGRNLSRFLAETDPYRATPVLAEIARFEWAMTDAFDAQDATVATVADMAAVAPGAWPSLRFGLHPSLQRIELQWNAPPIWKAVDENTDIPEPQQAEYPIGWMLWRNEFKIYFRSLSVDQAWMLDQLLTGATFSEVCEGLTEWIDAQHVAAHAAGLLKQWLEDGLIATIDY
ncbi:MAG: putative DNA-binding domain-containing protein [Pseudomonadota bacterium]|nr:MAG: putative DNA-binding domain-containing protein [Pseudomonadota bacterium]